MSSARGSALIETLVALTLVTLAVGTLAHTTVSAGAILRATRARDTARVVTTSALEALRAGPRRDGHDGILTPLGTFDRTWQTTAGRGRPDDLRATTTWGSGSLTLETTVLP